jgi:hypothetical protein
VSSVVHIDYRLSPRQRLADADLFLVHFTVKETLRASEGGQTKLGDRQWRDRIITRLLSLPLRSGGHMRRRGMQRVRRASLTILSTA